MKILEAYDIFKHVRDEYQDPGIEDFEFARYFNMAQRMCLERDFEPNKKAQPPSGFEKDQYQTERWQNLISQQGFSSQFEGTFFDTDIEAGFPTTTINNEDGLIESRAVKYYHIASVARMNSSSQFRPVKWVPHNDWHEQITNECDPPDEDFPIYRYFMSGGGNKTFEMYPTGIATVEVMVVRYPTHVWLDLVTPANDIDPELTEQACYQVIFKALQLAGTSVREEDFYQLVSAEQERM
jgi:hypothetical protein